jgi:hypothetical protein
VLEEANQECLEGIIGIEEKALPSGLMEYGFHTDVRELVFKSKGFPVIEDI